MGKLQKFQFKETFNTVTIESAEGGKSLVPVSFKKLQVVDGEVIPNTVNSEPPNFVSIQTSKGEVRIPYLGRGEGVLTVLESEYNNAAAMTKRFYMGMVAGYALSLGISMIYRAYKKKQG